MSLNNIESSSAFMLILEPSEAHRQGIRCQEWVHLNLVIPEIINSLNAHIIKNFLIDRCTVMIQIHELR